MLSNWAFASAVSLNVSVAEDGKLYEPNAKLKLALIFSCKCECRFFVFAQLRTSNVMLVLAEDGQEADRDHFWLGDGLSSAVFVPDGV